MSDSPLNAALNRNWIKASAEHERLERENADLRSTNAALTTILDLCTEGTEITYGQVPDMIADLRAQLEAARKDAERYRKLLALTRYDADAWSVTLKISAPARPIEFDVLRGQRLSIALDAAIAQGKEEK